MNRQALVVAGALGLLVVAGAYLYFFTGAERLPEEATLPPRASVSKALAPPPPFADGVGVHVQPETLVVPPLPRGSIVGVVLDKSAVPVVGVEVVVHPVLGDTAEPGTRPQSVTNEQGRFRFDALPLRMYGVVATGEGFAVAQVNLDAENPSQFVRMVLGDGGAISGTVVGAGGEPIADALVEGVRHDGESVTSFHLRALSTTHTDASGVFQFDALPGQLWEFFAHKSAVGAAVTEPIPVGSHEVRIVLDTAHFFRGRLVRLEDSAPVDSVTVRVRPQGLSRHAAQAVSESDGTFLVGALMAGPHVVSLQDSRYSVSQGFQNVDVPTTGTVTISCVSTSGLVGHVVESSTGAPIKGVQAVLYPRSGNHNPTRSSVTGADGAFEVVGLPPIEHAIHVVCDGDAGALAGVPVETVTLKPGQTTEVLLRYPMIARVTGTVIDAEGNPVPDALVEYRTIMGRSRGGRLSTDASARFAITTVAPGDRILIGTQTMEYRSEPLEVVVPYEGATECTLTLNQRTDGVLAGRVTDVQGRPLAMRIHTFLGSADARQFWSTESGIDGAFVFPALPPGPYSLGLSSSVGWNPMEDVVHSVELLPGQRRYGLRLVYDPESTATITGFTVDAEGAPIRGAMITAEHGATILSSAPTGADGAFMLVGLEEGAEYRIDVMHDWYYLQSRTVLTTGSRDVVVTMAAKPTVSGHVADSDSRKPIVRFSVAVGRAERIGTWTTIEHPDGYFELPCNVASDRLVARADGYREAKLEFPAILPGDRVEDIKILLDPGSAEIRGRVLGPEGPVPQVCVELGIRRSFEPPTECASITGATGEFAIEVSSDEPTWITMSHPHLATDCFLADPTQIEDYRLTTGGAVIVRTSGNRLADLISVTLRSVNEDRIHIRRIGGDGAAVFDHVVAGTYEISLNSQDTDTDTTRCEVEEGLTTEVELDR